MVMSASSLAESGPPSTLALDFANGASGPALRRGFDPLASVDDFVAWWDERPWTGEALPFPAALPDRRTLLIEARQLRAAIRETLQAVATGSIVRPDTLFVLNRAIAFARRSDRLTAEDTSGQLRLERPIDREHPLAPVTVIALDAAEFATSVDPARLRVCVAEECGTWYVDTSKGGRRRWCSMSLCGNRSKAARYRTRHTPTD